ncbi:uncharacterized protein [Paramisgurnus dabryanus]|uniref:uncharacterized protein n=1 Tax=Paramisgurnus dabryanus TaxID=90735 RepID=UPI0031F45266
MELFIITLLHLLMEVQSYNTLKKPIISVDDSTNQFTISCEIPLTVKAEFICNLYTEYGPLTHRSYLRRTQNREQLCMFYMSLSEIFKQNQTVNSRQLSCDYSVKTDSENEMNLRSPRSDVLTVRGFPQAKLSVSSSVIMDRDTVQLDCSNSENQKMDECYFIIDGRENKQSRSCQLSLTRSDISIGSGGQRSSVIITCYYTVYKSQVLMPSPHSDPVTVTVQGYPQAKLSVSSSVIMDRDTVQLDCSNSENQMMDECYFIIDGRGENSKQSRSCQLSLPRSDIGIWSGGQRSSFIITCYYTVYKSQVLMPSPHSDPVTVTVQGYPQAKLSVSSSVIMDRDTVQLDCSNSENQMMDECYFIIDGRGENSKQSRSCQLSLPRSDIGIWSGGQRSSFIITCYYTVYKSQVLIPSPHSDPVTVQTEAVTSRTKNTAAVPRSIDNSGATPKAKEKRMLLIMLLAVACSVIVLTGLICLCGFACKKRSKR